MATFALVHGAWGSGWHWAEVPDALRRLGHDVVAPDLPCEDPDATFDDYATVVLDALAELPGDEVVVVGFSLNGHTAARVATRRPVRELVYLAALVPEPGLSLNDQMRRDRLLLPEYTRGLEGNRASTRWVDFDVYHRTTCHDCAEPVARERFERSRSQSSRPYADAFPAAAAAAAQDVASRYILCTADRLMDNSFWPAAVRALLGCEPVELRASHSPMASVPEQLARLLAEGHVPGGR